MKEKLKKLFFGMFAFMVMAFGTVICLWNNWVPLNTPEEKKVAHISIDDTLSVFLDLTINKEKYVSLFENEMFQNLQKLHRQYGASFSLYCYYETDGFNLSMVPDQYQDEFKGKRQTIRQGGLKRRFFSGACNIPPAVF